MAHSLGIDIGGTTTKGAYCTDAGEVVFSFEVPTPSLTKARAAHLFVAQISQQCALRKILPADIPAIGVAVAGAVNSQGELTLSPNVDIDLPLLEKAFSLAFAHSNKVFLNDANAAALCEYAYGAGRPTEEGGGLARNVAVLTLGTGIGAGLIIDGQLAEGSHGLVGELGHLCVKPGGTPCNCGKRGCLEQYASASALVRMYQERVIEENRTHVAMPGNAKTIFDFFAKGDGTAAYVVGEFCDKLAFGLAQVACMIDPDLFIIGGGVSLGSAQYESLLKSCYQKYAGPTWENVPIRFAQRGGLAGCIGAAMCALQVE